MPPLPPTAGLALRNPGLQRQRMQQAAHLPLERLVDDLVLLHARLPRKDSEITVAA